MLKSVHRERKPTRAPSALHAGVTAAMLSDRHWGQYWHLMTRDRRTKLEFVGGFVSVAETANFAKLVVQAPPGRDIGLIRNSI